MAAQVSTTLPLLTDYQMAVINPASFEDPELKSGKIMRKANGQPKAWSGQFATIFQMETANGYKGVRCFTKTVVEKQERYGEISGYIQGKPLGMMTDFQYLPNGIRVNNKWYPIV